MGENGLRDVPRWHGVFAVDPGGTTGVAWGVFNLHAEDVGSALADGSCMSSVDVGGRFSRSGGKGHPPVTEGEQARTIAELFWEFESVCSGFQNETVGGGGLEAIDYDLVIEDWQPRLPLRSGERVVFYPVRIAATLIGMLYSADGWVPVVWQQPSTVKKYATDERLRRWGKWVRGSDHQRDAWRHVASRLNWLLA